MAQPLTTSSLLQQLEKNSRASFPVQPKAESSDEYYSDEEQESDLPAPKVIPETPLIPIELPADFLSGPPPNLTKSMVEFKKLIPEYDGKWAMILDGVLSQEECDMLVAYTAGTSPWERAMVNIGGGRQAFYEDTRKCGRIIVDDRDLAAKIWARVEAEVSDIHRLTDWADVTGSGPSRRKETWQMTRLNERMRFLKYIGGEYFKPHCDGCYETPDKLERSYFTLHLYLNGPADKEGEEPLEGGETAFHGYNMLRTVDVTPKAGRVLIFQQRGLIHSGDDVLRGTKYTMRTDIMYQKAEEN